MIIFTCHKFTLKLQLFPSEILSFTLFHFGFFTIQRLMSITWSLRNLLFHATNLRVFSKQSFCCPPLLSHLPLASVWHQTCTELIFIFKFVQSVYIRSFSLLFFCQMTCILVICFSIHFYSASSKLVCFLVPHLDKCFLFHSLSCPSMNKERNPTTLTDAADFLTNNPMTAECRTTQIHKRTESAS